MDEQRSAVELPRVVGGACDQWEALVVDELGGFETKRVDEVESEGAKGWLIESLWASSAAGILGGSPKSGKSWVALDLALSVATGTKALSAFEVRSPGAVLVVAAEDSPGLVKARLDGIAKARGVALDGVELHLVIADRIRLDEEGDQEKLAQTIQRCGAKFVVLDPFIRLQTRVDENSSGAVALLLSYLRGLQRQLGVSIMVVHHTRKERSGVKVSGSSLRGSGDFHAWGDSNLYLRRVEGALELVAEHRNAPKPEPVHLELVSGEAGAFLRVRAAPHPAEEKVVAPSPLRERILRVLATTPGPSKQRHLRRLLGARTELVGVACRELAEAGLIERVGRAGWRLSVSVSGDGGGGAIPGNGNAGGVFGVREPPWVAPHSNGNGSGSRDPEAGKVEAHPAAESGLYEQPG